MAPAKSYFLCVVKINYMQLLLALVILLRRIHLKRLNHNVVLMGLTNIENLMGLVAVGEMILKLFFAKLTMKRLPSVACYVWSNFLVFVSA